MVLKFFNTTMTDLRRYEDHPYCGTADDVDAIVRDVIENKLEELKKQIDDLYDELLAKKKKGLPYNDWELRSLTNEEKALTYFLYNCKVVKD